MEIARKHFHRILGNFGRMISVLMKGENEFGFIKVIERKFKEFYQQQFRLNSNE